MLCRQELQRKREERRQHENDIADEEIAFLKASGKVSTKPSNVRRKPVTKKSHSQNMQTKPNNTEMEHSTVNTSIVSSQYWLFTPVTKFSHNVKLLINSFIKITFNFGDVFNV